MVAKSLTAITGNTNNINEELEEDVFNDVPSSHWAAGYIDIVKQNNLMNIEEGSSFQPEKNITYEEAYYAAVSVLWDDTRAFLYPTDFYMKAIELGLTEGLSSSSDLTANIKKADLVQLYFNMLNAYVDGGSTTLKEIIYNRHYGVFQGYNTSIHVVRIDGIEYTPAEFEVGLYRSIVDSFVFYKNFLKNGKYVIEITDIFTMEDIDNCYIVDSITDEGLTFRPNQTYNGVNFANAANKIVVYIRFTEDSSNKMSIYNYEYYDSLEEMLEHGMFVKNDRVYYEQFNKIMYVVTGFADNDITKEGYLLNTTKTVIPVKGYKVFPSSTQYTGELQEVQIVSGITSQGAVPIDTSIMTASGELSGIEVGSYTAILSLNDKDNYCWDIVDESTGDFSVEDLKLGWAIQKACVNAIYSSSQRILKYSNGGDVEVTLDDISFENPNDTAYFLANKEYYEITKKELVEPRLYNVYVSLKDTEHYYAFFINNDENEFVVELEVIENDLGDLDGSGKIDIIDVRLLLQAFINSSSTTQWTEQQLAVMDIDGNEKIDIIDVRLLLQIFINT